MRSSSGPDPRQGYFERRRLLKEGREYLHRVRRARKKALGLKDVEGMARAMDALESALRASDSAACTAAAEALERRVAGEPAMRVRSAALETADWIIKALVLAMIIRGFFVEAFRIPSGSMEDTLWIGDHLFVGKLSYGLRIPFTRKWAWQREGPQPGEIVVFKWPGDNKTDFIKRVIGVPGDTIRIVDGAVYRNGEAVPEPYVTRAQPGFKLSPAAIFENDYYPLEGEPRVIPPDMYFVLGDNRYNSKDSRYWGYVPVSNLVGRPWRIYWSSRGCLPFDGEPCSLHLGRIGLSIQDLKRGPNRP